MPFDVLMRAATPLDQPRALGQATVSSKLRDGRSCIDGLRQSGALKILFPRATSALEATLINTAGGITGGDDFRVDATAGSGSTLRLTTQAAERVYRAQSGQTGRVATRLVVGENARLDWLPQETILFDGAALRRKLHVELAASSRFLMVEPMIFGRTAMAERVTDLALDERIEIRRDGAPLYLDGVRLHGNAVEQLDRPAVGGGARAMANLIWVAPEAEAQLGPLRALIGEGGGASLLRPDLLCLRLLAPDGYSLRRMLLPVLDRLTDTQLPASWRL